MKTFLIATMMSTIAAAGFTVPAQAKGCLKGAVVGGVLGHMAGHGKMGAVAGCAVGHHNANKKAADQAGKK